MLSASSSSSFSAAAILLDMRKRFLRNVQLFKHFVVALKDLDRVPALLFLRKSVHDGFLDVRKRMLDRTGEHMLRDRPLAVCRVNSSLGSFLDAGSLQRGDLHDLAAQLP